MDEVAQLNRGRADDPAQAALSGSHHKAPGSAGGYLLFHSTTGTVTPRKPHSCGRERRFGVGASRWPRRFRVCRLRRATVTSATYMEWMIIGRLILLVLGDRKYAPDLALLKSRETDIPGCEGGVFRDADAG